MYIIQLFLSKELIWYTNILATGPRSHRLMLFSTANESKSLKKLILSNALPSKRDINLVNNIISSLKCCVIQFIKMYV